ncbi:MAG TPA: LLM class flavin-dependent oxidoreductase [Bryobacteraceae bacterium]|nr:LLM class flavin-dependent oxidoreductase [Bryobacteraceae bacterium]
MNSEIELFSTCPVAAGAGGRAYMQEIVEVAHWSETAGFTGMLVYSDNSLLNPWALCQIILENTGSICPLPAIQPVYMHPYSVAKAVTTLAYLYGRRVCLNMIAGGFTNDLAALNDTTPHDKRYARLVEYTAILQTLLAGETTSYNGEFYKVDKLQLRPPLPRELSPGIFISGSSDAGLAAARALGATAIKYPQPSREETGVPGDGIPYGVRLGIIAREKESDAWRVARARFPEDRKGQLTQQLAMKVSDSVWHRQLSTVEEESGASPYWLVPFRNYKTFCPYLVGSYDRIAEEVTRYMDAGYRTFIFDIPPTQEELSHIGAVFERSRKRAAL